MRVRGFFYDRNLVQNLGDYRDGNARAALSAYNRSTYWDYGNYAIEAVNEGIAAITARIVPP